MWSALPISFDLLLGDDLQGRKSHIADNGYKYLELADIFVINEIVCTKETLLCAYRMEVLQDAVFKGGVYFA